jgi:epsilon-lactone hydrolase
MTDIYAQFVKYYGASNVILAGDSAGGNLCLSTAINAFKNKGLPPPGGVVLISPWCDLTSASMDSPSMTDNAPTDYLPPELVSKFADDYVTDASDLDDELVSPVRADAQVLREACPNTFLCYGTGEELLDQDRALASKMQPAEVVELIGMPHVSPLFATAVYGEGGSEGRREEKGGEEDVPQPVVGLDAIIKFINTRC